MNALVDKISKLLMPFAKFMNTNKYITTIRDTFVLYMPFIMVGSFASLFSSLLCSDTIGLAAIDIFSWLTLLQPAFNALNFATISCMSLIIVAILGGLLGKKNGMKSYTAAGIAFCCYISLIPQEVQATIDEASAIVSNTLSASSFNAQGLFLAIFVAIISVELFSFLMKFEKIKIKMPKEVPEGISSSFNAIIPAAIVLFLMAIIGGMFKSGTGYYINEWFYNVLQAPFHSITETPLGLIIIVFMTQILWWFGIHGGMVMSSVTEGLMIAGLAANIEAVNSGAVATHWFTKAFNVTFLAAGGSGIVISLLVCLILFSKRDEYKQISKACLIPALFSISEPAAWGEFQSAERGWLQLMKAMEECTIEAAITGNYGMALQAFMMNPCIISGHNAKQMLDEMLVAHEKYLPQFKDKIQELKAQGVYPKDPVVVDLMKNNL